jgi:hypothetical protein
MKPRFSILLAALVLSAAVSGAVARQDANQPAPAAPPQASPPPSAPAQEGESIATQELPPSAYVDGERPAAKSKTYDQKITKLWPALLEALNAAEVPVDSADEGAHSIQTRLIAFDQTRFKDVATPPPAISRERPIRQPVRLIQGWFSVEIRLTKVKGGTQADIRAYIEAMGHDVTSTKKVHVERFSNGKIEDYFFGKIDEALK